MSLDCFEQVGLFLMFLFLALSILNVIGFRVAVKVFWFVCCGLTGFFYCFSEHAFRDKGPNET